MTKFDGDWIKIGDFLLVAYIWTSIIFLNQSLPWMSEANQDSNCKPISRLLIEGVLSNKSIRGINSSFLRILILMREMVPNKETREESQKKKYWAKHARMSWLPIFWRAKSQSCWESCQYKKIQLKLVERLVKWYLQPIFVCFLYMLHYE